MAYNKNKKKINKNKQKTNISEEEANKSVVDIETESSKQTSDNEDNTSSVANNVMPAILKRLETLERLQTANHNKATNNHGFDVDSDDTSDNSIKKKREKPRKRKSTSDNTSDEDSTVCIYQFLSKIYYMFVNIQFIIQVM